MGIESRTTNTGLIPAVMHPMTVDLVGPKGVFARMDLPEVRTSPKGADVNVEAQRIQIVNMEAYLAFSKSLQLDERLTLQLDNGKGVIKAMGLKANIMYKKNVSLLGMDGPDTQILKTVLGPDDGTFTNTMRLINPSPLELEMGECEFAFKNAAGKTLATQRANLFITRGEYVYEATGKVVEKGDIGRVSLVGLKPQKDSWVKESLALFSATVKLTPELTQLLKE